MKVCISCNQLTDNFSKDSRRKDGLYSRCKPCFNLYAKERNAQNPERVKEIVKKSYQKNKHNRVKPERTKEQQAKYNKANSDKNPEKVAAYNYMKRRIKPIEGKERHHWSYLKDNWLDVIFLSRAEHKQLHKHMRYNRNTLAYTSTNDKAIPLQWQGVELNTKQLHLDFLSVVIGL
jgi:hypothetical protein